MEGLEPIVAQYLRTTSVLVVVLDADGRVRVANDAAGALLGRDPESLAGADWFSLAVPAEQRAARRERFVRIMAGDIAVPAPIEADAQGHDGVRRIEWHTQLLRDAGGRVSGTISSGVDVTERSLLAELTRSVATLEDPREAICRGVAGLTGAVFAGLWELAEEGMLEATAQHGELTAGLGVEPGIAATALRSGEMVVAEDGRAVLCRPVLHAGRPLGVLVVAWAHEACGVPERDARLVGIAADEASIALQRLRASRALRHAALSDPLTGAANRRRWEDELALELARARRSGRPLTVLALDLNAFKALNDRAGHAAGDRRLRAVTAAWIKELRAVDLLARLGGDEFAVLLPDCDAEAAQRVAARLREVTPHEPGCGIGAATWDGREPPAALAARADAALYADKATHAAARLHDPARLAAVHATGLTAAREGSAELDRITELVAWLLDVPVSLVSLVTDERQSFAGMHGLRGWAAEDRGTPLSHSFCQHAVSTRAPLVIPDARRSSLVRGNPAIDDLGVAAYAGVPLVGHGGEVVGVLCAIDERPRAWTDDELAILNRLAERAVVVLAAAAR